MPIETEPGGAPFPVAGVLEARILFHDAVAKWGNKLYIQSAGAVAWSQADAIQIANAVGSGWTLFMPALHPPTVACDEVIVTDLTSSAGVRETEPVNTIGTNGNAEGSIATCMEVQRNDGFRYRGGHSKLFLGGIPAIALATPNAFSSGYLASFQTAIEAWMNHIATASVSSGQQVLVNVHRFAHGVKLNPPTVHPINNFECAIRPATQRRRLGANPTVG